MYVLGLNGSFARPSHDPSVFLYKDGELIYSCEEERVNRIRFASGILPDRAISACLEYAHISINEISYVAFPQESWGELFYERLQDFFETKFGYCPTIRFYHHHLAHVASAYYNSGFNNALVISADGSGDGISGSVYVVKNGEFQRINVHAFPNSLGLYYSLITQFLGYRKNADEYKVMGLSAYGENVYDFSKVLTYDGDGGYLVNPDVISEMTGKLKYPLNITSQDRCYSDYLESFFSCKNRKNNEKINQAHMDIAASAQKQLESVIKEVVKYYINSTGIHNVCLAGGTFMNCLLNGKVYYMNEVHQLYVPPVSDDSGTAMGAAILCMKEEGYTIKRIKNAYYGEEFTDDNIREELERCGITYEFCGDGIYERVAQNLYEHKIIGWFQGRMEIGARALGSRSILASPMSAEMKKKVNDLKRRENYQPFAPSVLDEEKNNYFIIDKPCSDNYMTITFLVRKDKLDKIPAVTNIDGTSRVQSISKSYNNKFHKLIETFYKMSDCPVLLNTSLNRKNEPIVRTINEALAVFYSTEMDGIAIGNFYISK